MIVTGEAKFRAKCLRIVSHYRILVLKLVIDDDILIAFEHINGLKSQFMDLISLPDIDLNS